ncbi:MULTISPECIES: WhiB family transcriptional regulator [Streptomyces]|uniref:Transcriptional regulator WhiB n=1 Tax=Streptomyces cadmiisoli TaxID=2184053 RepID=A0A2Z4ITI7_9ACTN|nr:MULTISPECIES: WhiB family transcriptional regulator [Streptomyces]AWW36050.1 WhiB family transcriptional regulator [Streptomyces cadmiisoli]KOV74611.1 transcription factor WhiB [Streptomyces sp. AS58]
MGTDREDSAAHWRERAACLNTEDPDLFFPVGSGVLTFEQTNEAKAVCAHCPVMMQCLTWALRAGRVDGIWGGTTEIERRRMKRRHDQMVTG